MERRFFEYVRGCVTARYLRNKEDPRAKSQEPGNKRIRVKGGQRNTEKTQ